MSADQATVTTHAGDAIILNGREVAREDVLAVLGKQLDPLPHEVRQERRVPLGVYRGLRFGLVLHPHVPPEVYLEGATIRHDRLVRGNHGPRAVLNALERLAAGFGPEIARARQDLSIAESQLRDYQERIGKPFVHDAYQAELAALRDQLKAGLAGKAPDSEGKSAPTVSELAERIKALTAERSIDTAPERTQTRRLDAEEPVTSRIRRHAALPSTPADTTTPDDASIAPLHEPDTFAFPGMPGLTAVGARESSRSPKQYREQLARERQSAHHRLADPALQR